jgi:hypothetical protein
MGDEALSHKCHLLHKGKLEAIPIQYPTELTDECGLPGCSVDGILTTTVLSKVTT